MSPPRLEFVPLDQTTKAGRKAAFKMYLDRDYFNSAVFDELREQLGSYETFDQYQEELFARRFKDAVIQSRTHIGEAWQQYTIALNYDTGVAVAAGRSEDLTVLELKARPKIARLSKEFAEVVNRLNDPNGPTSKTDRYRLALDALKAAYGLLREVAIDAHLPKPRPGETKGDYNKRREKFLLVDGLQLRKWANLGWIRGIPVGLTELRNAESHGDITVYEGGVDVFFEEDGQERKVSLTPAEIGNFVTMAIGCWEAFILDTLVVQACNPKLTTGQS